MTKVTFEGLEAQGEVARRLSAALESPVPAYLFVGPSGSGKRDAARRFAGELFARGEADENADRHRRLALMEQHSDLVVIERDGPSISIEQAREAVRTASLSPVEANVKVILLVDFHLVGARAPVVLKAIEEPPPSTIFVILANDIPSELVTIASRCVQIDFVPLPEVVVIERLVDEGISETTARAAARSAGGDLDRARLMATDELLEQRMQAWAEVPRRLDGSGHAVAAAVVDLLEMVDAAAEPLRLRHEAEIAALEERVELTGERGSGRRDLLDHQKRELRRHRTDELRIGLSVLGTSYRDSFGLADGESPANSISPEELVRVGDLIQQAAEALVQNPTERLLLQATFLQLPQLHT